MSEVSDFASSILGNNDFIYILDFYVNTVQNVSRILVYTEETVTPPSLLKKRGVVKNTGWVGTRGGEERRVGRNAGLGLKVLTSLFLIHLGESYEIDTFLRSVEDRDLLTAQYKIHILKIASFFSQQFTNLTTNLFFLIYFFFIYFFLYFFRYIKCMSTEKKNNYLYVRENI